MSNYIPLFKQETNTYPSNNPSAGLTNICEWKKSLLIAYGPGIEPLPALMMAYLYPPQRS